MNIVVPNIKYYSRVWSEYATLFVVNPDPSTIVIVEMGIADMFVDDNGVLHTPPTKFAQVADLLGVLLTGIGDRTIKASMIREFIRSKLEET